MQAGRSLGAGNGIEVKDRRRLSAELLVMFKAAVGKQPRGKAPQDRPSVHPHACVRALFDRSVTH
jgi:hypothetical protein